jgi:hypothetical protein
MVEFYILKISAPATENRKHMKYQIIFELPLDHSFKVKRRKKRSTSVNRSQLQQHPTFRYSLQLGRNQTNTEYVAPDF